MQLALVFVKETYSSGNVLQLKDTIVRYVDLTYIDS